MAAVLRNKVILIVLTSELLNFRFYSLLFWVFPIVKPVEGLKDHRIGRLIDRLMNISEPLPEKWFFQPQGLLVGSGCTEI